MFTNLWMCKVLIALFTRDEIYSCFFMCRLLFMNLHRTRADGKIEKRDDDKDRSLSAIKTTE